MGIKILTHLETASKLVMLVSAFILAIAGQMIRGAIFLRCIVCFSGAVITAIVNVMVYLGWAPALVN